ncbi:hypothetical protein JT05_04280 [Desulfosporosinus sp. Tol-M]|nr:hypothetical protein JT05_04280 [Desulfosporosinus sp. Tol-M]
MNHSNEVEVVRTENDLMELTVGMLLDARATIYSGKTLSVPITELSTLGAGVSSLIPALNTVTQTTTFATEGLYQLANAGVGDVLKIAKNGNFWGAFKTADGASKFAQLQAAGPLSATTTTAAAINPAIMLMAVALFSIEKELGNIAEMEKQILSFLEVEKEAEIEADVETLMNIVTKYKLNWDNEHFVASNHKLVLDIQRTARKNMNAYQKKVNEVLKAKQFIVAQNKVNSTLADLEKKFKYYRLSLYTFSLASLMEIMLSANFKEEYISGIKDEIREMSQTYRDLFGECSVRLEKMGNSALEANVVKGLGTAGEAIGKFIGNIPLVKKGPVDEFLQDKGAHLKSDAIVMEKKSVGAFAAIGNPGTGMLVEKMQDMVQIYNHTSQICFDKEKIYLVAN